MYKTLEEQIKQGLFPVEEQLHTWSIGLYEGNDMTVTNNVGVQNLWITKYENDEKVMFAVQIETNSELANRKDGKDKVLNTLALNPTYENGDFELIEAFETEGAALEYATKNYPIADLIQLIKDHYSEDELHDFVTSLQNDSVELHNFVAQNAEDLTVEEIDNLVEEFEGDYLGLREFVIRAWE